MPLYEIATKKKRAREASKEAQQKKKEMEDVEESLPDEDVSDLSSNDIGEDVGAAAAAKSPAHAPSPKAAKVEFSEPAQWVERMALTATRSLPADLNADDDPKREEAFVQQALLSATRGVALLEKADVPWRRPDDYYAEMYKSDVHMSHVRKAMEASKARIEAQAHRRATKDQKKYGKEVQAEVLRQRAKYKRDMQNRLDDWKKKRKGNDDLRGYLDNADEDATGGKRGRGPRPERPRNLRPGGSKRRPGKNARGRQ